MPEMHLKQPGFTYSACGSLKTNKELKSLCKQETQTLFTETNLLKPDKACFQHDMVYGKSKDLGKRTQSDKVLRHKAFKIGSDPKYDGYERALDSLVNKIFDKKSSGSGNAAEPNYQFANELQKQVIRKFKKRKVYYLLETIFEVLI